MDSQTLKSTVVDAEKLEQFQKEIQEEVTEFLNNSNLNNLLDKYGLEGEEILTIQVNLSNLAEKQEVQNSIMAIPSTKKLKGCIVTTTGILCTLP